MVHGSGLPGGARRWREILSVVLYLTIILMTPLAVWAQDQDAAEGSAVEAEHAQRRLAFMNKAMARNELTIRGEKDVPSQLIPAPLLRWSTVQGNVKDGTVYGFSRGGRPDVLMQFAMHRENFYVQEFTAICEHPISMKRDGREFWRYDNPSIEFKTLADVKPPLELEAPRTAQLRQLAESFEIQIDHGSKNFVRMKLRLLRQPLLRYQDADNGIIDGAVFGFVVETDPEAILLLEAYQSDSGPQWRYACAEMTINALQVTRDGKMVWEKPDIRIFCQSFVNHYTCPYRPVSDDVSLEGVFAKAASVKPASPQPTPAK